MEVEFWPNFWTLPFLAFRVAHERGSRFGDSSFGSGKPAQYSASADVMRFARSEFPDYGSRVNSLLWCLN